MDAVRHADGTVIHAAVWRSGGADEDWTFSYAQQQQLAGEQIHTRSWRACEWPLASERTKGSRRAQQLGERKHRSGGTHALVEALAAAQPMIG